MVDSKFYSFLLLLLQNIKLFDSNTILTSYMTSRIMTVISPF